MMESLLLGLRIIDLVGDLDVIFQIYLWNSYKRRKNKTALYYKRSIIIPHLDIPYFNTFENFFLTTCLYWWGFYSIFFKLEI